MGQDCGDGDVALLTSDQYGSAFGLCRRRLVTLAAAEPPRVTRHVVVYREPGRFAGWPANHGMWSWGDEILVGFSRGYYKDRGPFHHINKEKPEEFLLARSQDGGATWSVEAAPSRGAFWPARRACATASCRPGSPPTSPPSFRCRSISPIPTSP